MYDWDGDSKYTPSDDALYHSEISRGGSSGGGGGGCGCGCTTAGFFGVLVLGSLAYSLIEHGLASGFGLVVLLVCLFFIIKIILSNM